MICSFSQGNEFNISNSKVRVFKVEAKGEDIPVIDPSCDLCKGKPRCADYCPTKTLRCIDIKPTEANVIDRIRKLVEAQDIEEGMR
jgi:Fe-S-cluster-containing hydrogenase component 2